MPGPRHFRQRLLAVFAGVFGLAVLGGCHSSMTEDQTAGPRRDINAVLRDHDRALLARPGVVGVYVGLLDDEKSPCLKIMLARKDRELERSIPPMIEGYPVVTEVTGPIQPMAPAGKPR